MSRFARRSLVLGVHPTSRGLGWALFENPFTIHNFGVYTPLGDKNVGCLRKVARLLSRYEPEAFIVESFAKDVSLRSERIRKLCLSMVTLAAEQGAELAVYRRDEIEKCFSHVKARTRDEIAAAVAQHLPALRVHLPKRRRPWNSEDKRLSLFAASALVLTHYQNGAATFLDDLRNAA